MVANNDLREAIHKSLCLTPFASLTVERHVKPEVETSPEMTTTETFAYSDRMSVLLESSINSSRISIKGKKADEVEELLTRKYSSFLCRRADKFRVIRRQPIEGYDMSFLITDKLTDTLSIQALHTFILQFIGEWEKELSEMKLTVNSKARATAEQFLTSF